jgi:hypothetical protein
MNFRGASSHATPLGQFSAAKTGEQSFTNGRKNMQEHAAVLSRVPKLLRSGMQQSQMSLLLQSMAQCNLSDLLLLISVLFKISLFCYNLDP